MIKALRHSALTFIPVFLLVSFIAFSLQHLAPDDAATALVGESADSARIAQVRHELGLDQPFLVQYGHWLAGVVHGDLGTSFFSNQSVAGTIAERIPTTLSLVVGALALSVVAGMFLGVLAGSRWGGRTDRVITVGTSVLMGVPVFWFGLAMVLLLSLTLRWLPATGYVGPTSDLFQWLRHLVLPVCALAIPGTAEIARQTRAGVAGALDSDYVRTLRAAGVGTRQLVLRHAVRNTMLPVITVIGLQIGLLLSVSVVVEQVFSLPGLGTLIVQSAFRRDVPVIQGVVLVTAVAVVLVNVLVDLSYAYFNPKVRSSHG